MRQSFFNYEMAYKHTDLLLVISLSLKKDLLDQSKAGTFTCLYKDLSLTLKMSHTENFLSCL